jgi:hypothetical protein
MISWKMLSWTVLHVYLSQQHDALSGYWWLRRRTDKENRYEYIIRDSLQRVVLLDFNRAGDRFS